MTPVAPGERPQPPAGRAHAGDDLLTAITGPPSAYAEASLEAEADRTRAPAGR